MCTAPLEVFYVICKNAGVAGIFILTGHERSHLKEISKDTMVCKNLYYAARKIIVISKAS